MRAPSQARRNGTADLVESKVGERHPSSSPWSDACAQLDRAAELLGLEPGMLQTLRKPRRSLEVAVPIRTDSADRMVFEGYRVQHSLTRGPGKGGLRYHPEASLAETKALAMWMTWKCALMKLPYGGAKGGVRCDPSTLSPSELEHLTRRYAHEIAPIIGPDRDIIGPDLNTGAREMAWIMDTLSAGTSYPILRSVTGRPAIVTGSDERRSATGVGVAECVRSVSKNRRLDRPIRVAISGYGNVGRAVAADLADDDTFLCVALGDVAGGRYDRAGLALDVVERELREGGDLRTVDIGDALTPEQLLTIECDVLIPAAVSGAITGTVAEDLAASVVVEAANGPTTRDADEVLTDRGIAVVPDILANGGGVVASHLELTRDVDAMRFPNSGGINDTVRRTMRAAYQEVRTLADDQGLTLREAALSLGVGRVVEMHLARGLYP